ncbi:MAG TPA: hypothetical protein VEX86_18705 [Longimicrobium sp.]|nr:hypothetical protein [Longimicrobium sp.]
MDAPGDPDPAGGVNPPPAFYGLWPRFGAAPEDRVSDEPRIVTIPTARSSSADLTAGA